MVLTDMERFSAKTIRGRENECWPWAGRRNVRTGRALFRAGGRQYYAARWLFAFLSKRPLGPDERVLHQCDNVACVNPGHLFSGTQLDNIRDRDTKGRNRLRSTRCVNGHPLTEANVRHYGPSDRWRACRPCLRDAQARYRARSRSRAWQ